MLRAAIGGSELTMRRAVRGTFRTGQPQANRAVTTA